MPGFHDMTHEGTAENIKRFGRSVICVSPGEDDDGWPFAYTIGNHIKRLPELLVIGTSQGSFLNDLSQMMIKTGRPFLNGQLVRLEGARAPIRIIRANGAAQADYTIQAGEYFGHQGYAVMQVLIPDDAGRFAGEDGCQPPYSLYPLLRVD